MATLNYRLLTTGEKVSFLLRHPFITSTLALQEGEYIKDDSLGGYVLIFRKTTGEYLFILSPIDPSSTDPNSYVYILGETAKAIKQNTTKVFTILGYSVSGAVILIGIVFAVIYLLPLLKKK